jgi:hypothetical protein
MRKKLPRKLRAALDLREKRQIEDAIRATKAQGNNPAKG